MDKMAFTRKWAQMNKRQKWALAMALCGLIFLLSTSFVGKKTEGPAQAREPPFSEEEQLSKTLETIVGAGKVKVMISYEGSKEIVPAMSTEKVESQQQESSGGSTRKVENINQSSHVATVQGGQDALVIKEIHPPIRGVIVVAQGAGDLYVRAALQRAVETVLQVSPDKVDVFVMKS